MPSLDDLEYEYYDKGTKESLIDYADSLTAADDPLGRLITLELEANLSPEDRNLRTQYPNIARLRNEIINRHVRPGTVQPRILNLTWQDGLVVKKAFNDTYKEAAAKIGVLLGNRAGRALRYLRFYHSKRTCNYKIALQAVVDSGAPNLRELDLSQSGSTGFDGLRGLDLSAPRLEVIRLRGKVTSGALKALATTWPNLHTLIVDFELTPVWKKKQSGKKLAQLFAQGALPKIRYLRLERTGLDDILLKLIQESGVLGNLEFLNLGGFFSASAVQTLVDAVPDSCPCLITRYEPRSDHQTVVDIVHRGIHPQQNEDYAHLWMPLKEEDWWEDGCAFYGAELKVTDTNVSSVLPDGTLHGRQTQRKVVNGMVTDRRDQMYWYNVKHGHVLIRNFYGTQHQRFVNGLRDEDDSFLGTDILSEKKVIIAQGVKVECEDNISTKEEELHNRFGVELTLEANSLYTLGPAQELSDEQASIPQISKQISKTDQGMRAYTMSLKDGGTAQVVIWSQGDTTSGLIIQGSRVLGEIEDMEIRLPSVPKDS